jgi:transposase-like protein
MVVKPYHDEDWLRELYIDQNLTLQEISDRVGCSKDTIWRWKNKHGLQKPWKDEDKLRQKYVNEELSMREIAEEWGCNAQTIKNRLDDFGIETRSTGFRRGNGSVNYYVNNWGHAHLGHGYDYESHSVFVHRLLAVAEHGFDAVNGKEIHHKNGIPWDNRPDNLELLNKLEHSKRHYDGDMPWRDKDKLSECYDENDRNAHATGRELGCTPTTVLKWVEHFKI